MNNSNRLQIKLFGTPEVSLGGQPVLIKHAKARALLFYLAAAGQPQSRDFVAALLWSEAGSDEAHHSLRSSLYHLRQGLQKFNAGSILVGEGESLSLDRAGFECDVFEFKRLIAQGGEKSLAAAVELFQGPLLQGFTVPDALLFEEWVRREDSLLSQSCLSALDFLAKSAEDRQDWDASIRLLQKITQIDPLAEEPQRQLMKSYLLKGEVAQALRQFRQFEIQLDYELGLAPSPETQSLLQEILRRQPIAVSAPSVASNPPRALPFSGRKSSLDQLAEIGMDVATGRGATVLIEGEGGIGKSRLLGEMAFGLVNGPEPWIVLQGSCSPFDDLLSYGPFLEALQSHVDVSSSDRLPELDPNTPDEKGRFSWQVLQTLRSLSHNFPLLLAIEDLQWANSSTLSLFGFLSMRIHNLPVLLLGTVQHAEAIPALQRLLTLQRRRGELHLLSLSPLPMEAVYELLCNSGIDKTSVETLTEWLHARSGGSPFLLTEILAELKKENILVENNSGWQLETGRWLRWKSSFSLPETTYDLVAWRLSSLPAESRHLLDVLAVAGQPLPEIILREFQEQPPDEFLAKIEDLFSRSLIIETSAGLVSLPHHLLRETLLHRLTNLRKRMIYNRLASLLEKYAAPQTGSVRRQIALYAVSGEDIDRARQYGLEVLPDLPRDYTGAETVAFVHHLYDLLSPSASPDESIKLTRALGAIHQALGHREVAFDWYRQTLHWAQKAKKTNEEAETNFELSELALMTNDYRLALESARQGLSLLEHDNIPLSERSNAVQSMLGRGHRLLGAGFAMDGSDLGQAENHLREAVAAHRLTGDQEDLCAALFELGNISAQRGELQTAIDLYRESAQAAEKGKVHYYLALAHNNLAYHMLLLGKVEEARQSALEGLKVAESFDLLAALLHLYSTMGEIHLFLGEWNEAEINFRRGLSIAEDLGSVERQAGYRGGLAQASTGKGDYQAAVDLLEEALALIEGQGYWHLRTRLELWLAETLFLEGRLSDAKHLVRGTLKVVKSQKRLLLIVEGECVLARIMSAEGDWARANSQFSRICDQAADLRLPLVIARVQASWGKCAIGSSDVETGQKLISAARSVFTELNARADLDALD